jgi:hypothetical protein
MRRLRGGANLVAVSGLLRHASTRMTERYLHVTRADLKAAAEAGQPHSMSGWTDAQADALLQSVNVPGPAHSAEGRLIKLKESSGEGFMG